jgi:cysteine synthase A
MAVYQSMTELVGHTPLLKLNRIIAKEGLQSNLFAKVEFFNPTGSVKDRPAKEMIEEGERQGKIVLGKSTLIEATSGNMGIGLAAIGTAKGYPVIIVMPDSMSVERRKLMKGYGAQLVLTPGALGMKGAIAKAEELSHTVPGGVVMGQFVNLANPLAHQKTTGPEIFNDLKGKVDFFVAGVGTGGTLSGVSDYLKTKIPALKAIAVEPASSAVLSGEAAGPHKIQGIGAGFIPKTLDTTCYDEVIKVTNEDAFTYGRMVGQVEGILVGISSGAALKAAIEVAKRPENKGKNIVVLFPDSGDRYLSTPLFED